MFNRVLIANRGEIALRILRACQGLGLETVVVYSEADKNADYVRMADFSVCIGPAPLSGSYMNSAALLLAAKATQAEAIHPGYGFLSENAQFAERVTAAGLTFIGPSSDCLRTMGDKIAARHAMLRAGMPCVPGYDGVLPDNEAELAEKVAHIGYPMLIKAAGGGGGRGMRVVENNEALSRSISLTRQEAQHAFNNDRVYIEKYLDHPRHVEIQVLCDSHGRALWLGSRDCSLQRRHQKVLEEAPAAGIDPALIAEIGQRCVQACLDIGYCGVGTFEFLYQDSAFYFIEMNTRLQVEHPVTEMTTGIDIVQQQIRVARGESLQLTQETIRSRGHAIECRINAEDPITFMPAPGVIQFWEAPSGPGVRVDTHVSSGFRVSPFYDSMIAKLIAFGADRNEALSLMRQALNALRAEGINTTVPLHQKILLDPGFCQGDVDIHYLERWLAEESKTEESL